MKDNIKMYLKEIEKEGMDGINLAEDRVRLWAAVNVGNGRLDFMTVGYFCTI
jgi:hypothetical protein